MQEPDDILPRPGDEPEPFEDPLYVRSKHALLTPRPASLGGLVFIGLFLLFVLGQLEGLKSLPGIFALIAVLLFHEAGHALGMRVFGFRDVRMFFIPFLGAAVSGRGRGVAAWKDAVVSLLGPLPGIYLGGVLTIASVVIPKPWLAQAAQLLLLLNLFNLLPFGALDGGRFLQRVFFSRHRVLDIGFQLVGSGLLAWLAISSSMFGLFAFVLLGMFALPFRYRVLKAASGLDRHVLAGNHDPEQLSDAQLFPVYLAARDVLSLDTRDDPQKIGQTMESVLEAAKPAPGILATILLLAGYGVSLVVGLVAIFGLFAMNPTASWRNVSGQGFHIDAPQKVQDFELHDELLPGTTKQYLYRVTLEGAQRFTVSVYDLSLPVDSERMLKVARERLVKSTDLTLVKLEKRRIAGAQGQQLELSSDDRKGRARLLVVGQRLYEIVATAPELGEAQERFLDSFTLDPNAPSPPAGTGP